MKNKDTVVHIVFTIDNKYVQHCAVTLTSIFINNKHLLFEIYIIHNGISKWNQRLLIIELSKYHLQGHFIYVKESPFKDTMISHHLSSATYLRLLLPILLPKTLDKVLFLDSDMVVRENIDSLWHIDVSKYSHAAVENPMEDSNKFKENLGLQPTSRYFNAGLLLINLSFWREYNVLAKAIDFLKTSAEKIILWDQDILNSVLENKGYFLPYDWNVQEAFFIDAITPELLNILPQDYEKIKANPKIIHFTGSDKPWFSTNKHPFKAEYFKYLGLTAWKNYKPRPRKLSLSTRIVNKVFYWFKKLKA